MPFKPRGEITDIPVENWKPQRLMKTIRFYNETAKKYKLPYYPTRVFKDSNGLIIAILLENNRIIQVIPEKTSVDLIEASGKYYVNVNKYISNTKEKTNERVLMSHTLIYQNETYELLRMEIANFLQSNKEKVFSFHWMLSKSYSLMK
jgi:hypothetical protein